MSTSHAISIFYIPSPFHVLGPIESYLTKRNYTFNCESNIALALDKIAEQQPHFIFIALDHPEPIISSLSKIIRQTLTAHVIHYVNSNSKEQIQKLENLKESYKLFPPLSGPGVERSIQLIKKEQGPSWELNISQVESEGLSPDTIERFKSNLKSDLKTEAKARNILTSETGTSVTVVDTNSKDQELGQIKKINDNNELLEAFGKVSQELSDEVKKKLTSDFNQHYQSIFHDLLKTAEEHVQTISDGSIPFSSMDVFSFFQCFIIKSMTWCGYVVVASPVKVSAHDLEMPIASWLKGRFQNFQNLAEQDLFHIQVEKSDYIDFIKNKVEYSEKIKTDNHEMNISFFATRPSELLLILNDSQEMLEVPLEIIPTEIDLPMNLYVHLPENKKYILFTSLNKPFASLQKERLVSKGVKKLFTQVTYEKQLNQMKAEFHINHSITVDKKLSNNE